MYAPPKRSVVVVEGMTGSARESKQDMFFFADSNDSRWCLVRCG